ncbi:MAG: DUF6049 family protein [Actinomycetota bacterium]
MTKRSPIRRIVGTLVLALCLSVGVFTLSEHEIDAGLQRPAVTLLSQSSFVSGTEGSFFLMSLQVSRVLLESIDADTRLVLTSHRPVSTREEVRSAVRGDVPQIIDAVSYSLADLVNGSSASESGRIDLTVRTEIGVRTDDALQMSATGVYPLTIDIEQSSERVLRLISFIERLEPNSFSPTADSPIGLTLVGRISPTISPPLTEGVGTVSDQARQLLTEWTALLERRPVLPASIALQPEFLDAIGRSSPADQEVLIRLQRAATFDVMSTTYVNMDPSDADRHGLSNIFTRQLRLGESTLASLFPARDTVRRSWLVSKPLSSGGARFLADLGFRTLVLTGEATDIEGLDTSRIDATRLIELEYSDDGSMMAAVADTNFASALEVGSSHPFGGEHLIAHQLLAELRVLYSETSSVRRAADSRALVLSTTAGDMPSPKMVDALFDVVSRDPRFGFTNLDDALMLMIGTEPSEQVTLTSRLDEPSSYPASSVLGATVQTIESTVDAFASALPRTDDRIRSWQRVVDVLPDNRLSPNARQELTESIRRQAQDLAANIVPPASTTFTLGGRDSPIRFSIRNDGPTDLDVLVRLRSSKLRLPEGDKIVSLPARTSTSVEFAVGARSNGRFPVSLQLLTPTGDVLLGPPSTLTARVNAIAGLGQLVTGIALLFLVSWWANHFRRQYRRRQAESA